MPAPTGLGNVPLLLGCEEEMLTRGQGGCWHPALSSLDGFKWMMDSSFSPTFSLIEVTVEPASSLHLCLPSIEWADNGT